MKLFNLPVIYDQIRQALEEGQEPEPGVINYFIQEGPKAVDDYFLAMDEVKGEIEALKAHLDAIKGRLEEKKNTLDHMNEFSVGVLNQVFEGKVKTALGTYWTQITVGFDFPSVTFEQHPEFFRAQEPKLDKKELIDQAKKGTLPVDIEVVKTETVSARIKR